MLSVELTCPSCQWRTVCGEAEIVRRMRRLGLFRRAPEPPEELVREVLRTHASRLTCDHCGAGQLDVRFEADDSEVGEWQQAVVCEVCRQPIPPERLAVLPAAKRCAACQDATDRGAAPVEHEYCPRCGAIMELRVSRAVGITRYKLWCTGDPPCRH